jgi:hypothetical protein
MERKTKESQIEPPNQDKIDSLDPTMPIKKPKEEWMAFVKKKKNTPTMQPMMTRNQHRHLLYPCIASTLFYVHNLFIFTLVLQDMKEIMGTNQF